MKRDDYSIYDSVVSQNLYKLSLANNPIDKITPDKWRNDIDYKSFNKYIGAILDSLGIDDSVNGRRRFFDHYFLGLYEEMLDTVLGMLINQTRLNKIDKLDDEQTTLIEDIALKGIL